MKRKFINIALSLLSVILGLAYSAISADAEALKPYVPLAWIAIGVGGVLTVFFSLADDIKFKFLSLFFQKNLLTQLKASIDELERKLIHDPDLEDVNSNEVLNRLNNWEEIGEDLIVMSLMYKIEKAYLHAKQALEIVKEQSEDNPSQDKTEEYDTQAIMISIANKMYEEYCSLLHQQPIK